jgi:hypothetical protein
MYLYVVLLGWQGAKFRRANYAEDTRVGCMRETVGRAMLPSVSMGRTVQGFIRRLASRAEPPGWFGRLPPLALALGRGSATGSARASAVRPPSFAWDQGQA